jgi:hypothetical protein
MLLHNFLLYWLYAIRFIFMIRIVWIWNLMWIWNSIWFVKSFWNGEVFYSLVVPLGWFSTAGPALLLPFSFPCLPSSHSPSPHGPPCFSPWAAHLGPISHSSPSPGIGIPCPAPRLPCRRCLPSAVGHRSSDRPHVHVWPVSALHHLMTTLDSSLRTGP